MKGYDAVVVGAGAAGVGVGVALSKLDLDFVVLERDRVGASFRDWPEEMRFITPSFPSNSFGVPDLNAVTPKTSPAFALDREHPSGEEYADYLEGVAEYYELPVETGVEVTGVRARAASEKGTGVTVDGGMTASDGGFVLGTDDGEVESNFVVWATGQYGKPRRPFEGADFCVNNTEVNSWKDHADEGDEFVVIGGYESGIDAAVGLIDNGCSVTVIDAGKPWAVRAPDPSVSLSPYTLERFEGVAGSDDLTLAGNRYVERVERYTDGCRYAVVTREVTEDGLGDDEERIETQKRPVLATGFKTEFGPADEYFPRDEEGVVPLTDRDESPVADGLFLAGPEVAHNGVLFCFIYKYRTRFPVVAETIGERLGVDTEPLGEYREENMFMDDLSCCEPDMCDC
jgi:cation diffusion facilitator CzcD-associated flavoprotein CzcO